VAEKAKIVYPFFILSIKLTRERQSENEGVIRAMGVVTGDAVALCYRTMQKPSLFPLTAFLMTAVAECIDTVKQEMPAF